MDQNSPITDSESKIDVHLKSKIKWKQMYMMNLDKSKARIEKTKNTIEPTSREYNTFYVNNCVVENNSGFLQEENYMTFLTTK